MSVGITLAISVGACGSDANLSGGGISVKSDSPGSYTLSANFDGSGDLTVFASTNAAQPIIDGDEVATMSAESVTIDGLDEGSRWYFGIRDSDGNTTVSATRHIALEGANNVRDLGGYRTEDGRTVKWGTAFRAANLSELTDIDRAKLETANISTVVDFRLDEEIESDGADQVSDSIPVQHLPILFPLMDTNGEFLFTALSEGIASGDGDVVEELLGGGRAQEISEKAFVRNLDDEAALASYAETLKMIAGTDEGSAVLYHCTQGKDRTGMMSAILLGLLGVPDDVIIEDFVLSNEYNKEYNEQTYSALKQSGVDADLIQPLLEQRESQIRPVLDKVHDEYGGWDNFGREVLGLNVETIEELRDKLLT